MRKKTFILKVHSFVGMPRVKNKKLVKKALAAAKELEKIPFPTAEEIASVYKEGIEEAGRLQKLLKPSWFVRDVDVKKKKRK